MSLQKKVSVTESSLATEHRILNVRETVEIFDGDDKISSTYHRYPINPDQDVRKQVEKKSKATDKSDIDSIVSYLQSVVGGVWTEEVIEQWKQKQIEDEIGMLRSTKQSCERHIKTLKGEDKQKMQARIDSLEANISNLQDKL